MIDIPLFINNKLINGWTAVNGGTTETAQYSIETIILKSAVSALNSLNCRPNDMNIWYTAAYGSIKVNSSDSSFKTVKLRQGWHGKFIYRAHFIQGKLNVFPFCKVLH